MNIHYLCLIIIFVFMFLSGCQSDKAELTDKEKYEKIMKFIKELNDPFSDPPELVTEEQLNEAAESTLCDTLGEVRYAGRKSDFDYYVLNWNLGCVMYKLKAPNQITKKEIPYSKDEKKWLTVGPHDDESWLPNNKVKTAKILADLRSLPKEFKTIKFSGDFLSADKLISKINEKLKQNTPYKVINTCPEIQVDVVFRNATLLTVIRYLCTDHGHKLKITVKKNNIILQKMPDEDD